LFGLGFRIAFGLDEIPKPSELLAYGERWSPHATTAAWYLWRAADAAKNAQPAQKLLPECLIHRNTPATAIRKTGINSDSNHVFFTNQKRLRGDG